jgi:hypothetical protein
VVAAAEQLLDEPATDKPAASGDEDSLHGGGSSTDGGPEGKGSRFVRRVTYGPNTDRKSPEPNHGS